MKSLTDGEQGFFSFSKQLAPKSLLVREISIMLCTYIFKYTFTFLPFMPPFP